MALEYDSDDIGELDDDAEDTIQGPATVEQFDDLLTEFLEDHPTQDHNHEAGYAYDAAGGSVAGGAVDRAAVAKVRNMLTQQPHTACTQQHAHSCCIYAAYMLSNCHHLEGCAMRDTASLIRQLLSVLKRKDVTVIGINLLAWDGHADMDSCTNPRVSDCVRACALIR